MNTSDQPYPSPLPPVGKVFTDPTKPPGFGWKWSDEADPPRWLPPDASSPHFQQAIEDAHKAASSPLGCVEVGQMTDEAVAKATPQCWTKQHCKPDGTFCEDKYAAGFNACVESSPSPLPHSRNAPDPQGQDRGQGEGMPILTRDDTEHGVEYVRREDAEREIERARGDGEPSSNTLQLPTPQSAEEWAKETWDTMWKSVNFSWTEAMSKLIEPLARRCDEAEAQVKSLAHDFTNMHDEVCRLTAQLAAAQARITALNDENNTMSSLLMDERRDKDAAQAERDECRYQLAAAQAEAAEMRKQRDLGGKQIITLTAEINRLRKGITEIKAGTRIGWFMTDLGAKCEKLLNP